MEAEINQQLLILMKAKELQGRHKLLKNYILVLRKNMVGHPLSAHGRAPIKYIQLTFDMRMPSGSDSLINLILTEFGRL